MLLYKRVLIGIITFLLIGLSIVFGQGDRGNRAVDDREKKPPPAVEFRQRNQEQRLSRSARMFEDQGDFAA